MRVEILSRLWRADWHLSALLGLLLLVVFVIYPMSLRRPWGDLVLESFLSLILILGAALVAQLRAARAFGALCAAGAIVIGWARLFSASIALELVGLSLWIVFLGVLATALLIRVFGEGRINLHRIQGAVAAYLLLGVMWAGCYRLVVLGDPAAFNLPAVVDEGTLMSKLVYFSFATLTTVGYGDVTAVDMAARSLAMLEALTGQLFPAVLIARLVSLEVIHRNEV
ncbi:MAG TPA: potassium channel family protein [Blastocatellia bacterium]|nr:potassium channel family protein [Blastocatellia bacterium]